MKPIRSFPLAILLLAACTLALHADPMLAGQTCYTGAELLTAPGVSFPGPSRAITQVGTAIHFGAGATYEILVRIDLGSFANPPTISATAGLIRLTGDWDPAMLLSDGSAVSGGVFADNSCGDLLSASGSDNGTRVSVGWTHLRPNSALPDVGGVRYVGWQATPQAPAATSVFMSSGIGSVTFDRGVLDPTQGLSLLVTALNNSGEQYGIAHICFGTDPLDEIDFDGDGVTDLFDNCPMDANPGQEDADLDSFGDACDRDPGACETHLLNLDSDGDGVPDLLDNCADDYNPDQQDSDGDGIGDVCDSHPNVTDADGDGVDDDADLCPDTATGDPVDVNGCSDAQVDGDLDGICDPEVTSTWCTGSDNCPDVANPGQEDLDEDGEGDVCDPDADGDGDPATTDCDDLDPGRFEGNDEICDDGIDNDCDGLVDLDDLDGDCDGDEVPNETDNCPFDYNPGQDDLDEDGLGDPCDEDDDGDGVADLDDNCPVVANPEQDDFDGDGAGDACDDDGDGDGVLDFDGDLCHFTAPSDPDAGVPSRSLGKNRWADLDGDGMFDTKGKNPTGRMFSIYATAGCNCAQIIATCGYGQGHTKFGCSNSVMDWWVGAYDREGAAPYQCKEN